MKYRKDIQILRGISVIYVILFHLKVVWFTGGFLGVDIFFVISGFLMASLYERKGLEGSHALEFFKSRSLRLLPTYFLIIVITLAFLFFVILPHEFSSIAKHSLYSSLLLPNLGFWLDSSYFGKREFEPLLHLWSLGVELQFYLLVPLFILIWNKSKKLLVLIAVISIVACILVVEISSKTSFFLTPFRVWEFLLGFVVAKQLTKNGGALTDKYDFIGLIAFMVLVCLPLFDIGESNHPGGYAFAIGLVTSIVLALGLPSWLKASWPASILEKVGRYSYSLYLVHFPVILIYFYQPFLGGDFKVTSEIELLIVMSIIIALSVLMYHLVELPMRGRWTIKKGAIVSSLGVGAIIASLSLTEAQRVLFDKEQLNIIDAWTDRSEFRCGKAALMLNPFDDSCLIAKATGTPSTNMLLVGNSHADSIKTTLANEALKYGASLRLMVQNHTLGKGSYSVEKIVQEVKSRNINTVIIHDSAGSIDIKNLALLVGRAESEKFNVAFIDPVPRWRQHVPRVLWNNLSYQLKLGKDNARPLLPIQSLDQYTETNFKLFESVAELDSQRFHRYKVGDIFCATNCLLVSSGGKPLYFDSGHLTLTGAGYMDRLFSELISRSIEKMEREGDKKRFLRSTT